jgi:hypothetical protein
MTLVNYLTKEKLADLKRGEVVEYVNEGGDTRYLFVDHVDLDKGIVSGEITNGLGFNSILLEDLIKMGQRTTKWQ